MKLVLASTDQYKELSALTERSIISEPSVEIVKFKLPSSDDESHFGTKRFNDLSKIAVEKMIEEMEKMSEGDLIMYSDSDILFLAAPSWFFGRIGDSDSIFQYDEGFGPDAGFYVMKVCEKNLHILKRTSSLTGDGVNSQVAIRKAMDENRYKYAYFPTSDVWNYGADYNASLWDPSKPIEIPDNLKAFHANFTIGIDNKKKLLNIAIDKFKPYE